MVQSKAKDMPITCPTSMTNHPRLFILAGPLNETE